MKAAALEHIEASIRHLALSIDRVKPDIKNARLHGERNLAAIQASLKRFGQQRPVIIDATGVLVAGNGTWAAAKVLGWTTLAAIRTNLTGAEARAFALADNRTAELAEWDYAALLAEVEAAETVEGIGFEDFEIAELRERLAMFGDEADGAGPGAVKDGRPGTIGGGVVSLLVKLPDVRLVETAIRRTGQANRAEAIREIFASYLDGVGPE